MTETSLRINGPFFIIENNGLETNRSLIGMFGYFSFKDELMF